MTTIALVTGTSSGFGQMIARELAHAGFITYASMRETKELAPLGIETSIVVPGAFTTGTNHFNHAASPADMAVASAYVAAYPPRFAEETNEALAATVPASADPHAVARAGVDIVSTRYGQRPLRVVIDPASDGAVVSFAVIDRVRNEFLHRIGHADLLHPRDGF